MKYYVILNGLNDGFLFLKSTQLFRQIYLQAAAAWAVAVSTKVVNMKKGQFLVPWDMT